jgi:polyferredoxin
VQALGILLTIMGLFTNYPIAKALLLGITFIMGPVFCGWICPFGTLQDLFGMLGDKIGNQKTYSS